MFLFFITCQRSGVPKMGQTVVDPEKKVWEDRFVFSGHILACLTKLKILIKYLVILGLS